MEAVEASRCYFFKNWLIKPKFHNLLNRCKRFEVKNLNPSISQSHFTLSISMWDTRPCRTFSTYTLKVITLFQNHFPFFNRWKIKIEVSLRNKTNKDPSLLPSKNDLYTLPKVILLGIVLWDRYILKKLHEYFNFQLGEKLVPS